jgi:copper transport protein
VLGRGIALCLATIGGLAGVASAHASLLSSTPSNNEVVAAAPDEVVLTFDEAVRAPGDGGITVIGPAGETVSRGATESSEGGSVQAQRIDAAGRGTHTVSWRLASEDGHVIAGSYVFHVGSSTGSGAASSGGSSTVPGSGLLVEAIGAVGRALGFAGALAAVGGIGVALLVDRDRGPRRGLWLACGAAALAGSLLALLALSAELAGGGISSGPGGLGDVVAAFGWTTGPVASCLAAAALVVVVALPERWGPRWPVATALSLLVLVLPALSGHASVAGGARLLADAAHLVAAALWIGGLAAIAATWRPDRSRMLAFSRVALWSAAVVVASGAFSAWAELDGVGELTTTRWGRSLLVKLCLVAVVVALGWVHRRRLADAARSLARVPSTMRLELVVAATVLAVTAVLVDSPPPDRDGVGDEVQVVRQAGETTVRLQVVPAEAGPNEVHLYFLAIDGSLQPVDAAELRVSSPQVQGRRVPLAMITPSHASAVDLALTPGGWTFDVTVVRDGATSSTTFPVPID